MIEWILLTYLIIDAGMLISGYIIHKGGKKHGRNKKS